MKSTQLDEATSRAYRQLLENFGDPIGSYKGNPPHGAPDKRADEANCDCKSTSGSCKCTSAVYESDVSEVTPKGYEKIVKSLKRSKDVENPWAVAWWMKSKGIKPKKKK